MVAFSVACVIPTLLKYSLNDTCADIGIGAETTVYALYNETEPVQLLFEPSVTGTATVNFTAPNEAFDMYVARVGFVYTQYTSLYAGSNSGWHAEPLLYPKSTLPSGGNYTFPVMYGAPQALWVSFKPWANAYPGKYPVQLFAEGVGAMQINVVVLPALLPQASDPKAYGNSFQIGLEDGDINRLYGNGSSVTPMPVQEQWARFTQDHRMQGDMVYLSHPRDPATLELLASLGARHLNLIDVYNVPQALTGEPAPRRAHTGGVYGSCANYSQAYVDAMLALVKPTVEAMRAKGLSDKLIAYGFDENPISCEPYVRQLFGAMKKAYPEVRTMAVLNWPEMPDDLPVDIWVLQYYSHNETMRQRWVAAGHEYWQYWCVNPTDAGYLNTFIERPLAQVRQLFWLSWQNHATGMLYYGVDIWRNWGPYPSFVSGYVNDVGVTYPLPHGFARPLAPADGNVKNDPRLLQWDAANFIWYPRQDLFANGDGSFIMPGVDGPISSIRYETIRDGLEDVELLKLAANKNPAMVAQLAQEVVKGPKDFYEDPVAVMETRAKVAQILVDGSPYFAHRIPIGYYFWGRMESEGARSNSVWG